MKVSCRIGSCCAEFRRALAGPPRDDVRLLSIYSTIDEVVDPRCCRDPYATLHTVPTTHIGMGFSLDTWRALAAALPELTAGY